MVNKYISRNPTNKRIKLVNKTNTVNSGSRVN